MRRSTLLLVLTLLLDATGAARAAKTVTLPVGSAEGFHKAGDLFVPLQQVVDLSGTGPVSFEAEAPDEVLWAKGGRVKPAAEGSPACVAGFRMLRFYYAAGKAAAGALWARLCTDGTPYTLYVNDKAWSTGADDKDQAGKWRWVRLADLPVRPGVGCVQVLASGPGFQHPPVEPWPHSVQVDSFAVTFDRRTPEGTAPPPARAQPPAFVVESDDLKLPAAKRLLSAGVRGEATGSILEASVDGGATWQTARDLPLTGTLRLRLRFPQSPAPTTRIRDFTVSLETDPARYLVLADERTRIEVDVDAGGVFRLESPGLKTAFAVPTAAMPLFSLELKQRGKPWPKPPHVLQPADGKLAEARVAPGGAKGKPSSPVGPRLLLSYSFLESRLDAQVEIALLPGGETRWSLHLDNRSEWDVLTYTFPRIAGLKVGASGYDDRWLNTNVYGPWIPGSCYHGAFRPEDRPYPSWGALGYCDLFDGAAGLSCATREPEVGKTSFVLRPTTPRYGETVTLEVVKEHCVAAGTKRTWSYTLLPHAGDWHAAADAYGVWFRQRFGAADHWPEWVRDANGWYEENTALQDVGYRWPMLLDAYERGRRMGLPWVQVWGQFGCNSCAAFFWPSPKYGSIEEFAAANKRIRDMGGHVGYYLLYDRQNRYNLIDSETYEGYLPRSAYPPGVPLLDRELLIRAAMVADPEGKVTAWPTTDAEMAEFRANLARILAEKKHTTWADSQTWPKHSMAVMNPTDPEWQKWQVDWTAGRYVRDWHCDTAYQDVLGCGNVGRSFDLRRGDHGEVHDGEMAMARRLHEEGRKADPQFALSAEGKSELVTRWAMGMTSSLHSGWCDLAPHRYTHPDHILFFGGANGGYQRMPRQCDQAFLYGARFDVIMAGDHYDIRRAVTFRGALGRFALRARYRDTLGVEVAAGEGIDATRHERDSGGVRSALITVVNRERVPDGRILVDVSSLPAPFGAFWLADDGSARPAKLDSVGKGSVTAVVPAARHSALLLVARTTPEESTLAGMTPEPVPGGCRYRFWVANLTPQKQSRTLTLDAPGARKRSLKAALEPYGLYIQAVEGAFAAGEDPSGDVTLSAGGKTLASAYLYAPVEDGSFEKEGTPVAGAADGAHTAKVGPGKGWQGTHRLLNLAPGHRYRVSVMARRSGPQGEQFALVRLKDAAGRWHHHGMPLPKDAAANTWTRLTTEFDTPAELSTADIYLYNHNSTDTVEYDDIEVEMVR